MAVPARRLAAIMFTDLVGYSALAQADEAASLRGVMPSTGTLSPASGRPG